MTRVYFAAPLFCAGEKEFNKKIAAVFEEYGYDVFLPQRDGLLVAELTDKTPDEKVKTIFEKDIAEIKKSDVLVFALDGRIPDEGACVELGLGFALNKRCYGIRTDVRTLEQDVPLNPLIAGCMIKVFDNPDYDALIEALKQYLDTNKL